MPSYDCCTVLVVVVCGCHGWLAGWFFPLEVSVVTSGWYLKIDPPEWDFGAPRPHVWVYIFSSTYLSTLEGNRGQQYYPVMSCESPGELWSITWKRVSQAWHWVMTGSFPPPPSAFVVDCFVDLFCSDWEEMKCQSCFPLHILSRTTCPGQQHPQWTGLSHISQ